MSRGRALIILSFAVVLALGIGGHKAYAHFPASSGSLTAVLHVEPDDAPAAGQPQTIYFIFDDAANQFKLSDCTCALSISHGGQTLYASDLSPPDTTNTVYGTKGIPFTFSQSGEYHITLNGQPIDSSGFKPFNLAWDIPVKAALETSGTSATTILKYFAAIAGAFILLGGVVFLLS